MFLWQYSTVVFVLSYMWYTVQTCAILYCTVHDHTIYSNTVCLLCPQSLRPLQGSKVGGGGGEREEWVGERGRRG